MTDWDEHAGLEWTHGEVESSLSRTRLSTYTHPDRPDRCRSCTVLPHGLSSSIERFGEICSASEWEVRVAFEDLGSLEDPVLNWLTAPQVEYMIPNAKMIAAYGGSCSERVTFPGLDGGYCIEFGGSSRGKRSNLTLLHLESDVKRAGLIRLRVCCVVDMVFQGRGCHQHWIDLDTDLQQGALQASLEFMGLCNDDTFLLAEDRSEVCWVLGEASRRCCGARTLKLLSTGFPTLPVTWSWIAMSAHAADVPLTQLSASAEDAPLAITLTVDGAQGALGTLGGTSVSVDGHTWYEMVLSGEGEFTVLLDVSLQAAIANDSLVLQIRLPAWVGIGIYNESE